jgi:SP family myo-inositol transporter-like MFS transporter 13
MAVANTGDAAALFAYKDHAWRNLFWVALPPGILFLLGSLLVSESPRWLFKRGKKEQAFAALLRSRSEQQAAVELREMEEAARNASTVSATGKIRSRLALAPQVRGAVRSRLPRPFLHPDHRHQLHHRV